MDETAGLGMRFGIACMNGLKTAFDNFSGSDVDNS